MRAGLRGLARSMTSTPGPALVERVEVQRQRRQQRELLDRQVRGLAVGGEVDERAAVDVLEQLVALGRVVAREELRLGRVGDVEEQHAALRIGDRDGGDVGLDVHLAEDHVRAVLQLLGQRHERDLLHAAGERVLAMSEWLVAVADRHRLRRLLGARAGGDGRLARRREARHAAAALARESPASAAEEARAPRARPAAAVRLAGVAARGAAAQQRRAGAASAATIDSRTSAHPAQATGSGGGAAPGASPAAPSAARGRSAGSAR